MSADSTSTLMTPPKSNKGYGHGRRSRGRERIPVPGKQRAQKRSRSGRKGDRQGYRC